MLFACSAIVLRAKLLSSAAVCAVVASGCTSWSVLLMNASAAALLLRSQPVLSLAVCRSSASDSATTTSRRYCHALAWDSLLPFTSACIHCTIWPMSSLPAMSYTPLSGVGFAAPRTSGRTFVTSVTVIRENWSARWYRWPISSADCANWATPLITLRRNSFVSCK